MLSTNKINCKNKPYLAPVFKVKPKKVTLNKQSLSIQIYRVDRWSPNTPEICKILPLKCLIKKLFMIERRTSS